MYNQVLNLRPKPKHLPNSRPYQLLHHLPSRRQRTMGTPGYTVRMRREHHHLLNSRSDYYIHATGRGIGLYGCVGLEEGDGLVSRREVCGMERWCFWNAE